MKKFGKKGALALALVGCMAVAGISAYFTDSESVTNTFTVGDKGISVKLEEPNYPGNDSEEVKNITPLKEIAKDPTITNDGDNDAYAFLTVSIPRKNIVTANLDGTKNAVAMTELFQTSYNGVAGVNTAEWTLIDSGTTDGGETVTYVYAYATDANTLTVLGKGAKSTLFDNIKFVNAVEGQGLEGGTYNVDVKAYVIQSTNINDGNHDGENTTSTKPSEVYEIIKKSASMDTLTAID